MCANSIKTEVAAVDPDQPDSRIIERAAAILRSGGLVAFATETVYGLGAVATNPEAVARIFSAKGRPSFNPLIVHTSGIDQAKGLVRTWSDDAQRLAEAFWPGPLTLVLPRSQQIPDIVTAGQGTVGIRVPAPRVARDLIQAVGLPIAAPSANRSNRISPTRAEHVFTDLDGRVDLILDSGPTAVGLESTVLDLTTEIPVVLRPGPISASMLEGVLGRRVVLRAGVREAMEVPSSPGQLPIHYAPRARAIRIEPNDTMATIPAVKRIAVLELGSFRENEGAVEGEMGSFCGNADQTEDKLGSFVEKLGLFGNEDRVQLTDYVRLVTPEEAGRRLYEVLHRFDDREPDLIIVRMPPDQPDWCAVRDRLERATTRF